MMVMREENAVPLHLADVGWHCQNFQGSPSVFFYYEDLIMLYL